MRNIRLGVSLYALLPALMLVAGCGLNKKPEDHAQHFFNRGKDRILDALKQAKATPEQLARAHGVFDRSEKPTVAHIGAVLDEQRHLFIAVAAGKTQQALLAIEQNLHAAQMRAAQTIGQMHEELAAAVGTPTWTAASAIMEEKMMRQLKN